MAFNNGGITKVDAVADSEILVAPEIALTLPAVFGSTGVSADANGKKILKAGTPVTGSYEARTTPFVKETTTDGASNAVGILLQDVDVTAGKGNATVVVSGCINLDRIDSATRALITSAVKTALNKITFIK